MISFEKVGELFTIIKSIIIEQELEFLVESGITQEWKMAKLDIF